MSTGTSALISLLAASAFLTAQDANPPVFRLDGNAAPKQYRLDLTVDPAATTFKGSIEIDVTLSRATSMIWLNAADLTIEDAIIRTSGGVEQTARPVLHANQFLGLQTAKAVPAGAATLRIRYSGRVRRNSSEGLFARQDEGNWYAYTYFAPLDARAAFPCFDEPHYRAAWHVTLHVPSALTAVANGPVLSERPEADGWKAVRFQSTPPISTYLVAFAVGPFDVVDAGTAGQKRTRLRIIVPKGRGSSTTFARTVTPKVVEELERYFGIPYPFDKLDQIAFPGPGGGMENVGLITYGQTFLVASPGSDNIVADRSRATIIAHEIAHQWFGDLTTMRWWDDIWLNEAFASWMESRIVDSIFPRWNALVGRQQAKTRAIVADSLTSARRIRNSVENAGDVGQAFDSITYQKGSSVIAMFEHYLGEEVFRKGVKAYLTKNAWKNTTTADFLKELSLVSGKDVAAPFSTFLDRPGVPLLRIGLTCEPGRPTQVNIRQERLLPIGSSGDRKQTWQIPVCLRYPSGSSVVTECSMLTDPSQAIPLRKATSCPEWINADADGTGYYRVIYEEALRDKQPDRNQLTIAEQVNLVRNAQSLFDSGLMPANEALNIAMRFGTSEHATVAAAAVDIFNSAHQLTPEERKPALRRLVSRTFSNHVRTLGWTGREGEDAERTFLRAVVLPAMLRLGDDKDLDAQARSMTLRWLETGKTTEPALSTDVVRAVSAKADKQLFDRLVHAAENWNDAAERLKALAGLARIDDPTLAPLIVKWAVNAKLPPVDRLRMLVLNSNENLALSMWKEVQQNYSGLTERLPKRFSLDPGTSVIEALEPLCTAEERRGVQAFFSERVSTLSGGPRALAQTLEKIDLCVARKAVHQPALAKYLSEQN